MNMHILISCLTIFCCRIIDVSLGTIRTILTVKERTLLSSIIGFMEVFIWYIIVKDALTGDTPVLLTAISYAGGYATGTFVGGKLASALVSGQVTMQVVTSHRDPESLAHWIDMPAASLQAMRHIVLSDFERIFSFRLGDAAKAPLYAFAETFLQYHIDRRFSTLDFYRAISGNTLASPEASARNP